MRLFHKKYHPPGTAPGTLVTHAAEASRPPTVHLLDYSTDGINEIEQPELDAIDEILKSDSVTWLRVNGCPDADWMQRFGTLIDLHPLAQEDILNGGQRSKLEPYDNQLFIVMNLPDIHDDSVDIEQLYLFWHEQYLVTFYTGLHDPFEPLLKRLHAAGTRLRSHGLDYLAYAILDLSIDKAFPVLEFLGLKLEALEERMMDDPDQSVLHAIHTLKRQIILLRRAVWPQREVINQLLRDEGDWISEPVRLYLRDCYDHTVQIMDLVESYRDTGASLHDLYLSSASMRMNDIMRVLTIIATIFIPLTFIAGVYGMNFGGESTSPWAMPELRWSFGYPLVWLLFIVIAVVMLCWFRRKRWL